MHGLLQVNFSSSISNLWKFPNKTVYHPGPLTMWLSKADGNISEYDGSGYWFKTYETGVTWDPEASPAYYRLHWDASYITQVGSLLPTLGLSLALT